MKIDPYKHQQRHEKWKSKREIKGVSKPNSDLIVAYLTDMESGFNVTRRGCLSYIRLNTLRQRIAFMARTLEKMYGRDRIIDVADREIVIFFKAMRDGQIKTRKGGRYTSTQDYAYVFKAFWHWYQRVEAEKGNAVKDITRYIDTSPVKESEFVYFTIEDLRRMAERAKYEYKVMLWFLFDSGIRAPTELINVKVSDLSKLDSSDGFQLHIRDEISKTFGRKIKLLLCSKLLRDYISDKNLSQDDYLFPLTPRVANQYLKRLAVKVMGNVKTKGGSFTGELTMYDFRHSSACYWLPRYKSESAMKYRFGWKKDAMIHHYTKLLGMRDTIVEDDLLPDSDAKTKLERNLEAEKKTKELLQEQLEAQRAEMASIREQLAQSQSRDDLILRMLNSLARKGKMGDIVEAVKEEGMVGELVEIE